MPRAAPVMKAPAFDYVRPQSLGEAIALLAGDAGEARLIAGGQSLLALMNLRVAAPALLIDIARLPELAVVVDGVDRVILGAGITHAMIEDRRVPDPSRGLMPHAAASLAYRAVRNRGTLGGSLALADPAAEWPAVFAALDAEVTVSNPRGQRSLKCAEFATGIFQTQLADDEVIENFRVAKLSPKARWGYVKLARKSGSFADTLAVAVADPVRNHNRIVLGAANGPPLVLAGASQMLAENRRDPDLLRSAVAADLDRAADRHFDDFQRNLHLVAAARASQQVTA
jgi:aerobic carbon-monoxide dehydrogenase medium subunit